MFIPSYSKYEELRDKRGITDYRVSVDLGIPKSTFSEWKNNDGRSLPKIDKIARIADYFEVTIESLLEEVND